MNTEQLLRALGVNGTLKGFQYAIYMIELVKQDPAATTLITKYLYPAAAKQFNVSAGTCWKKGNRKFLEEVAGRYLPTQPSNGVFLDMAAAFLRSQKWS